MNSRTRGREDGRYDVLSKGSEDWSLTLQLGLPDQGWSMIITKFLIQGSANRGDEMRSLHEPLVFQKLID